MAQYSFDSTQYNPEQGAGQLSVGRHLLIIEKDEIKKAKEGAGGYLEFFLKGIQQSEAERGAYRLNLFNAGQNAAVTIEAANRQLSAVCHAVGVQGFSDDTSVLWNLPFMVEVGYQKGQNPATDGPDVKGYTEIKRVLYADGTEIKPGQYGAANGQQQQNNGGFNSQGQNQNQGNNTNTNNGNGNGGFGQPNQNPNQPQDNQQQQNNNGNNSGGNQQQTPQFGQNNNGNNGQNNNGGNDNNQNQNQNNGNNNGGGWKPGQGGNGDSGAGWKPRT